MQKELVQNGSLLASDGQLSQVGWSRQPMLDCNLESAHFYGLHTFQRFRIKRWDYYAVFTPDGFFSATISDLGYAGNLFVYVMDFKTGELHEEGLVVPFGKGVRLPRNSTDGDSFFENEKVKLHFSVSGVQRKVSVAWPGFHAERGIYADIILNCPLDYESMTIVIPIGKDRFYYNRKINCMPAQGTIKYGESTETLDPLTCIGSLDWGRGVWEYQ
jgi:hypothetical protein